MLLANLCLSCQADDRRSFNNVLVDQDLVSAAGIQKISGNHITLYTDVRDQEDLNELVTVFDLAVPQWCAKFNVKESATANWHVQAFLMAEEAKFTKAKLIPDDLPKFPAGYSLGDDLWVYLQPGNYYTRHLLLHEGTHAFMNHFLGSSGVPWFSEGMAEWLGVHQWDGETLKLGYRLRDRREADYWGRVKIIQDDLSAKTGMSLDAVFGIPPRAFQKVRFYGWSWAACEFFANHPLTQDNFSDLYRFVGMSPRKFQSRVLRGLSQAERRQLRVDWNLFIYEIDYGYDIESGILSAARKSALESDGPSERWQIAANRGWQTTDVIVRKGDQLTIMGQGRFQVKMTHQPWPCEAAGVTLEYYNGQPLGMLLAGVLQTSPPNAIDSQEPLIKPITIGYQQTIEVQESGILCLRINESPADLGDNLGTLEVTVEELK